MAQQSIFKSLLLATTLKPVYTARLSVLYQPVAGLKQETKNLLTKLNIPARPKKPMTPYFTFMYERRDAIARDNPNIKITEIAKKCAEAWKVLDNEKKVSYEQKYKRELEDWTRRFLEYESKLSQEQREALQLVREEKMEDRKKRKMRKLFKDTNKPKRPLTSYLIFAMEESKKLQKPPVQIASHLKEAWAHLSEQEKQRYQVLAVEAKKKYEAELAAWEKRMQEEGKEELVRKSTRVVEATPSRLVGKPEIPELSEHLGDCSGASEKDDIEVCDEKEQKQGLFHKVRKIFTA